jgi:transcriptional regulator with PAS, ATPase and Fis domain
MDWRQESPLEQFTPLMREVFDVMSEGILIIDEKADVFYANPAYLRFINKTADEVRGRRLRDFRPHARLPDVVASGKAVLHAQRLEGLEEAYFVNMYPIFEDGAVIGGLSVITFLDAAAKTRRQLEDYERRSQQVMKKVNSQSSVYTFDDIISAAPNSAEVKRYALRLAAGDMPVLLQGESGTGKELYAQSIHNASPRAGEVFLAVNCANFTAEMLDSELFGYSEGSFTGAKKGGKIGLFEAADGGTLFLDEISEMDIILQAKLLRVLQEHTIRPVGAVREQRVDTRVICASNADLPAYIEDGKFRKDLYYRLNAFEVHIPPLRERPEDIEAIGAGILRGISQKQRRSIGITDDALAAMAAYSWPGNVRELKNVLEYSAYMCENDTIRLSDLPGGLLRSRDSARDETLSERVRNFEREEINAMLAKYGQTLEGKKKTAAALGISLASLYAKLK